ncbi:hypothetical protein ASD65_11230 [Microbacterium sp. Root61]|uniref:1-phosphofructokinase family hexose kinase n=1 Tax=Microbacterium sp. Root61 TaxID=1736570 RepID=UPI0006FC279F|nr:PfkB family carbohydrate kinase [Microbacterium sp. Root61]KRA24937.1 hypothetical protein ASD65_11230 [Microbacterium sp. Root61]
MILTVTPNAAVDVTIRVEDAAWGESNRVRPSTRRAGGKGLNVSRVLSQMHEDTRAITAVGQDDLAFFSRDLVGVPHALVPAPGVRTRRSLAIVEDPGARRVTLFNEVGQAMSDAVWEGVLAEADASIGAARCLVVAGSTPPEFVPDRLRTLFRLAVGAGVPAIADLSGPDLLVAADCRATLLKPNRRELQEATGQNDPVTAAKTLIDRGARAVLVSLGEEGMLFVGSERDSVVRGRGPLVRGNPTGAGDAAVASLAGHLAQGITDPETLVVRAIAWSTSSVSAPEAGSLSGDLAPILADITLHHVRSIA